MPAVRTSPKSPAKTPKKASPKEPLTVEIKPSVLYQSRITNDLYHQIVVKTLEFALDKHMDWHKLSQAILADEEAAGIIRVASPKKGKGKGKAKGKGKEKEEEEEEGKEAKVDEPKNCPKGLTGIELRESHWACEIERELIRNDETSDDHFHNVRCLAGHCAVSSTTVLIRILLQILIDHPSGDQSGHPHLARGHRACHPYGFGTGRRGRFAKPRDDRVTGLRSKTR